MKEWYLLKTTGSLFLGVTCSYALDRELVAVRTILFLALDCLNAGLELAFLSALFDQAL